MNPLVWSSLCVCTRVLPACLLTYANTYFFPQRSSAHTHAHCMPNPSCFVTVTTRMMFDTSESVKLCSICHTDVLLCLEHTRGDIILPVSGHLGIPSHNNFSSINLFLCVTELPALCAAICSGSGHSNGDCLSSDSRTGWSAGLNTDNCLSV